MRRVRQNIWLDGACWFATYALLWYLLAGTEGWPFALPVLLLATLLALCLKLRPWYFRPLRAPQFLLFFGQAMGAGALDVARRALHPHCPVQPGWLRYPMQSSNPRVQLTCVAIVGLLPGTLAARAEPTASGKPVLHIHVLDAGQPHEQTLAALETQLDKLLLPLEPREPANV